MINEKDDEGNDQEVANTQPPFFAVRVCYETVAEFCRSGKLSNEGRTLNFASVCLGIVFARLLAKDIYFHHVMENIMETDDGVREIVRKAMERYETLLQPHKLTDQCRSDCQYSKDEERESPASSEVELKRNYFGIFIVQWL